MSVLRGRDHRDRRRRAAACGIGIRAFVTSLRGDTPAEIDMPTRAVPRRHRAERRDPITPPRTRVQIGWPPLKRMKDDCRPAASKAITS